MPEARAPPKLPNIPERPPDKVLLGALAAVIGLRATGAGGGGGAAGGGGGGGGGGTLGRLIIFSYAC